MKKEMKMAGNKKLFFDVFIGEYVDLVTKYSANVSVNTEDGSIEQQDYVRFQGYLLDIDDDFYYLGLTDRQISHAVNKSDIVTVMISQPETELDEFFNSIEPPEDSDDYN